MAFLQFPNQQYFRIFDVGETQIKGGYFNLLSGTELKYIMATIFLKGVVTTERVRFHLYGKDSSNTPICSSNWENLVDVGAYTPNWLGNIYFTFAGQSLNPNINYYMRMEIENYTRNAETFYIGVNLDWLSEVNTPLASDSRGFRIRILGER